MNFIFWIYFEKSRFYLITSRIYTSNIFKNWWYFYIFFLGFTTSRKVMEVISKRYANEDGKISFDDFVQSTTRIMSLFSNIIFFFLFCFHIFSNQLKYLSLLFFPSNSLSFFLFCFHIFSNQLKYLSLLFFPSDSLSFFLFSFHIFSNQLNICLFCFSLLTLCPSFCFLFTSFLIS